MKKAVVIYDFCSRAEAGTSHPRLLPTSLVLFCFSLGMKGFCCLCGRNGLSIVKCSPAPAACHPWSQTVSISVSVNKHKKQPTCLPWHAPFLLSRRMKKRELGTAILKHGTVKELQTWQVAFLLCQLLAGVVRRAARRKG